MIDFFFEIDENEGAFFACHVAECHSPPAHMALVYPYYFPEIRGTDGRTSQNLKRGSLLVNLANINSRPRKRDHLVRIHGPIRMGLLYAFSIKKGQRYICQDYT